MKVFYGLLKPEADSPLTTLTVTSTIQ